MNGKLALCLALICSLILSACSTAPSNNAESIIKIGFFGPLSGDSASDGVNARNAVQLAIDKANADNTVPGKTFELIAYDDRLDPTETSNIIRKLIDQDKVQAVISGSYSTPTRAAAPVLQQAKIPLVVAYATHPEITTAGDMVFRMIYTAPTEGRASAIFAKKNLNYTRFHVLNLDNDYGQSIVSGFTEQAAVEGIEIVSQQKFAGSDTDFAPQLTAIKAQPADALLLAGYYAQSAQIIQQARQMGITLPIIGSDGLDSPKLIELAGADAEGVILSTDFSRDDPRLMVQDFIRSYQQKYNTIPDIVASSSYDAANMIITAIKTSNASTSQEIRDAIASTTTFEGVTGIIKFTPEREVDKTILFVKIDQGNFTFLNKLDPEELK